MVSDYKYCLEEIEELKHQIEKMKCCENCDNENLCSGNFDCIAENYAFWKIKESD